MRDALDIQLSSLNWAANLDLFDFNLFDDENELTDKLSFSTTIKMNNRKIHNNVDDENNRMDKNQ